MTWTGAVSDIRAPATARLAHHADQVGAVFGASVDVAVQAFGGGDDAGDGVGRPVGGQRRFHGGMAEHAVLRGAG